ncbi:hypothetical protein [Lentzea sp. NBRC 105346]|uniref:hypothetical protein n=1 Tax=Lentzea sp. NBRC 105346 TaxID=3032205 RepID=UPI002553E332|nr:hypothetical protein [Lentzea sp. NBRC 105346]
MTAQLDVLRDLSDVKARYEEMLGWRVALDVSHRRLFLPVGRDLGAITMPAHMAVVVTAQLRVAVMAGPVIVSPGGRWHTFLTTGAKGPNFPLVLRQARVQFLPTGGQVIVPNTLDARCDPTGWCWADPPRPYCVLPSWSAVVVAAKVAVADAEQAGRIAASVVRR